MSERRPDPTVSTNLTGPITADQINIPVISTAGFRKDTRKRLGVNGEWIRCTGTQHEPWPMLTGCERGVTKEDGGPGARDWPAGTPVFEGEWSSVEIVTQIPIPTLEMVGRQFLYKDAQGSIYSYNVVTSPDGTPVIDWVNEPPSEVSNYAVRATSVITGLTGVGGIAVGNDGAIYVARFAPAGLDQWWMRKYTSLYVFAWQNDTDLEDHGQQLYWDPDNGGFYATFNQASGKFSATDGLQIFSSSSTDWGYTNERRGLATDGTTLYVTDPLEHKVYYSTADAFLDNPPSFGGLGTADGQFNAPYAAFVKAGELFILDSGNGRVQVFDATTRDWIRTITFGVGNASGQISNTAQGIIVDSLDRIWISDTGNHRLQVFSSLGTLLFNYGSFGGGVNQFNAPRQLALGASDIVFVADSGSGRVLRVEVKPTLPLETVITSPADGDALVYSASEAAFINGGLTLAITQRSGSSQSVGATSAGSQTVNCVAGEVSIGGGMLTADPRIVIAESKRSSTNGWTITARNTGSVSISFTPLVMCLENPI